MCRTKSIVIDMIEAYMYTWYIYILYNWGSSFAEGILRVKWWQTWTNRNWSMVGDAIQLLFVCCQTLVWVQASWEVEGKAYGWGDTLPIFGRRTKSFEEISWKKIQKKQLWEKFCWCNDKPSTIQHVNIWLVVFCIPLIWYSTDGHARTSMLCFAIFTGHKMDHDESGCWSVISRFDLVVEIGVHD